MANGIASLRDPDRPRRRVAPSDTLSLRELLGAMASADDTLHTPLYEEALAASGYRSRDQIPQRPQYPPNRLVPLVDSLHAFSQTADHVSGRQPPRIMTQEELIARNREFAGRGRLVPYNLVGEYKDAERTIWVRPHDLYGIAAGAGGLSYEEANRPFVDLENDPAREPLIHEFMHSVRPERNYHGPKAFTANTLTAAWEALAELEHGDRPRIEDVVDRVVELYPFFHSGSRATPELPREEAEEAVRWMVQQDPFKDGIAIDDSSILDRLKRGLGSFFNRDK